MLNDGLYIKLSINKYIKVVEGEKKLDLPTFNERERDREINCRFRGWKKWLIEGLEMRVVIWFYVHF